MGFFNKPVVADKELEDAKLVARLEKGRLTKEISSKEKEVDKLQSKVELVESKLTDMTESRDYYQKLENDREAIESEKKIVRIEREDLAEDKQLYEHRSGRLTKREARLEEEENDEYKKGYSDGLADGLRKAHDITREDRKYLTMIAMSTNQSEAIKTSQKALEGGFLSDKANA